MCDQTHPNCESVVQTSDQAVAARILRRFRALTGGKSVRDHARQSIVACSGGADSVALASVISKMNVRPVLVHVLHDLRVDGSAQADCDFVEQLAQQLGCEFVKQAVEVRAMPLNTEANARNARYQALIDVANDRGIKWVLTGHHADDQLETVLMRLMRGSGIRGMGGISECRMMDGVSILRPMLGVSREEIVGYCQANGLSWREDPTNQDQSLLRNHIRHEALPVLKEIEPDIAQKTTGFIQSCIEADEVIDQVVRDTLMPSLVQHGENWEWSRNQMRRQLRGVLSAVPFLYCRIVLDSVGMDRISRGQVDEFVCSTKSDQTDPREHRVGPIIVRVDAHRVRFQPANDEATNICPTKSEKE